MDPRTHIDLRNYAAEELPSGCPEIHDVVKVAVERMTRGTQGNTGDYTQAIIVALSHLADCVKTALADYTNALDACDKVTRIHYNNNGLRHTQDCIDLVEKTETDHENAREEAEKARENSAKAHKKGNYGHGIPDQYNDSYEDDTRLVTGKVLRERIELPGSGIYAHFTRMKRQKLIESNKETNNDVPVQPDEESNNPDEESDEESEESEESDEESDQGFDNPDEETAAIDKVVHVEPGKDPDLQVSYLGAFALRECRMHLKCIIRDKAAHASTSEMLRAMGDMLQFILCVRYTRRESIDEEGESDSGGESDDGYTDDEHPITVGEQPGSSPSGSYNPSSSVSASSSQSGGDSESSGALEFREIDGSKDNALAARAQFRVEETNGVRCTGNKKYRLTDREICKLEMIARIHKPASGGELCPKSVKLTLNERKSLAPASTTLPAGATRDRHEPERSGMVELTAPRLRSCKQLQNIRRK
jgi:hypothetical protein